MGKQSKATCVTLIFMTLMFCSLTTLHPRAQNRQEDQSLSSVIGLLTEADSLTKNDNLRSGLKSAMEAVTKAQKADKGSKELTGNLREARDLLNKIAADAGNEGAGFRDKITRAQQIVNDMAASFDNNRAQKLNGPPVPCESPLSPVDCNGEPRGNDGSRVPVNTLRRRYRVTLNGFRVNHQTNQGLYARWDAVTFNPTVGTVDVSGNQQAHVPGGFYAVRTGSTSTIGSVPENGVRGGSAGPAGGLITGDGFPSMDHPERRTEPYRAGSRVAIPPTDYFEGELIQNTNAAYIIPNIWLVLGPVNMDLLGTYRAELDRKRPALERIVSGMIRRRGSPQLGSYLRPGSAMGLGFATIRLPIGVPQQRPIGMQPERDQFTFMPQVLILTFDSAEYLSRTDFGSGVGIVPVRYVDDPSFGGDYTLYFQVERLRD